MNQLSRREKEKMAREADIINAAEKIFCLKGFNEASLEEIAGEAQFTRRTLYQYFVNKEDLFFAVVLKGFRQMLAYTESLITKELSGFDKLYRMGLGYYRYYKDFHEMLSLFNYIGYINKNPQSSPYYQKWRTFDNVMFTKLAGIIDEGKADRSIRTDLDSQKAAYTLTFTLTGFFCQLSLTGPTFTAHFALDQEQFVLSSLNLLFDAFHARVNPLK